MNRCFILICFMVACIPFARLQPAVTAQSIVEPDWPSHYQGTPLKRLELTAQEERFLGSFPGYMAKFTDGQRELHLRMVRRPTRMLHPISDCLRGAGYSIGRRFLEQDRWENTWGCVGASKNALNLKVCERIYDENGNSWSDVSAWYWTNAWQEQPAKIWWSVAVVETCAERGCIVE